MQWFQVLKTGPWIGPVFTTRAAKKKPGNFLISKPTIVFFAANTPCPAKHRSPEGAHAGGHRKTIEEKATAPLFETIFGFNNKPKKGPVIYKFLLTLASISGLSCSTPGLSCFPPGLFCSPSGLYCSTPGLFCSTPGLFCSTACLLYTSPSPRDS